ncbi:hypothetical protein NDU88_008935 [Pleurodeles waltl]|uniref:Uncharacterized protein n=1 Tax=Pleurodeles waltl TaxID=8319 RepID=A0AAV7QT81_PLEWA|nr:hypothetical protein NDU88_008935 [Pleurodeles waltl]
MKIIKERGALSDSTCRQGLESAAPHLRGVAEPWSNSVWRRQLSEAELLRSAAKLRKADSAVSEVARSRGRGCAPPQCSKAVESRFNRQ